VKAREQKGSQYFVLPDPKRYLKDGVNVLAIEGHASSADRADFLLSPTLVIKD
jgi:hypothetical protein